MLDYAAGLRDRYNLLLLDLRNSGRSGGDASTGGLWEASDVRVMIDWLAREKRPRWIAVVGTSDGAVAALAEAAGDPRVRALVLDSMHATVEQKVTRLVATRLHLPAWPSVPAVIAGAEARIGADVRSVDPIHTIASVAPRPVLLSHGDADVLAPPAESLELNANAARAAGVDVRVLNCPAAGHGQVVEVCGSTWSASVLEFLGASGGVRMP
jgi:pimeloyl-ACP methyl ester carboxylesterase